MAKGGNLGETTDELSAGLALPIGARVWLLQEGRSARVTACAHGGLLYRVRLESDGSVLARPGCELMRLHEAEADQV